MAAHSLVVAKASLAASMMRPDPAPVPRADIVDFHTLLESVVNECTPANVQQCKDWLLKNAAHSTARATAIGKYLVAFSQSLSPGDRKDNPASERYPKTSDRRKRLHILYLSNDLLHHTKYHIKSPSSFAAWSESLQLHLVDLIGYASAHDPGVYGRHQKKISDLLDLWEREAYYPLSHLQQLRTTVGNAAQAGYPPFSREPQSFNGTLEEVSGQSREAPYIMPSMHGDSSMPFYDLPAANIMPHIMRNRSTPINPQHVKPLEFAAGPADETLTTAVKDFLKDVDLLYEAMDGQVETLMMDIDAVGQPVIRDELTGDVMRGDGYYGWSHEFCEKTKRIRDGKDRAGQYRKREQGTDRSASPLKRRRLSYSESDESRSRSRSGASSRSRSRSRSQARGGVYGKRRRSYSRSSSQSQRRHPRERGMHDRPRSPQRPRPRPKFRSRSRSYSPPQYRTTSAGPPPPPIAQNPGSSATPPMPFLNSFNGSYPIPPHGLPIPPPPPPNYKGIWPPPPPPPPPPPFHGQSQPVHVQSFPSFSSFVPPPPPPSTNSGQHPAFSLPPLPHGFPGHAGQTQMPQSNWLGQQPRNNQGNSYGGRDGPQQGGRSGWSR